MTTFQIDTSNDFAAYGRIDHCEALQDAALDSLPPDAAQDEIDAVLAKLIVTDLLKPKRADTARQHFARYWPLINQMAPASYDFVFQEFAERLAELR